MSRTAHYAANISVITPEFREHPDFSTLGNPLEVSILESLFELLKKRFIGCRYEVVTEDTEFYYGISPVVHIFSFMDSITLEMRKHKVNPLDYSTVSNLYRETLKWNTQRKLPEYQDFSHIPRVQWM